MIQNMLKIAILVGLTMTICACGQSGRLYLPEPNQPTSAMK